MPVTLFLWLNANGDILQNVQAVPFNTTNVDIDSSATNIALMAYIPSFHIFLGIEPMTCRCWLYAKFTLQNGQKTHKVVNLKSSEAK